jgi:hypothetical protein
LSRQEQCVTGSEIDVDRQQVQGEIPNNIPTDCAASEKNHRCRGC